MKVDDLFFVFYSFYIYIHNEIFNHHKTKMHSTDRKNTTTKSFVVGIVPTLLSIFRFKTFILFIHYVRHSNKSKDNYAVVINYQYINVHVEYSL